MLLLQCLLLLLNLDMLLNKRNSPHGVPQKILPTALSPVTLRQKETLVLQMRDWGISLLNENVNESGTNEDGSTWYRESGEDLGENGYRCRGTRMGGQSKDGSSEWKET
ncbi:hypothetical protein SLEP1_g58381, partial [Rubroshorea leprosula]